MTYEIGYWGGQKPFVISKGIKTIGKARLEAIRFIESHKKVDEVRISKDFVVLGDVIKMDDHTYRWHDVDTRLYRKINRKGGWVRI